MDTCEFGICAFGRKAVPGVGPMPADIMLLGEAPGAYELKLGTPFVGRSGKWLDEALRQCGLTRQHLRISNTCGCVDMTREDKRPLPSELDACRPRLNTEFDLVNPKVILLMGNTAIQTFFPGMRIGEIHGSIRHDGKRLLIPTYHPAAVLRGNHQVAPIIHEALKTARRFAE